MAGETKEQLEAKLAEVTAKAKELQAAIQERTEAARKLNDENRDLRKAWHETLAAQKVIERALVHAADN